MTTTQHTYSLPFLVNFTKQIDEAITQHAFVSTYNYNRKQAEEMLKLLSSISENDATIHTSAKDD